MIDCTENIGGYAIMRRGSGTRESAESICIAEVLSRLVANSVRVGRENECPSDYPRGGHVRNLVGLSKEGLEWLVVRFDNKVSTEEVAVKLLHCENDGHGLLLQLVVVLLR